jgi:hypothetical protein
VAVRARISARWRDIRDRGDRPDREAPRWLTGARLGEPAADTDAGRGAGAGVDTGQGGTGADTDEDGHGRGRGDEDGRGRARAALRAEAGAADPVAGGEPPIDCTSYRADAAA